MTVAQSIRFALLLVLVSCVHTYSVTKSARTTLSEPLSPGAAFLVAVPVDASFSGRIYDGSGIMTTMETANALAQYTGRVTQGATPQSRDENLEQAAASGATHLIEPEVSHWEDRATEWSARPDRISVRMALVDVTTGETLDSRIISGKSRLATFGGDHPQELLRAPLERYADELFGARTK